MTIQSPQTTSHFNKMSDLGKCTIFYIAQPSGRNNEAFDVDGQLPDGYVIDLITTLQALRKVKTNKATWPDNVPAWILNNHANILAGPLTAIFNSSLREGVIPDNNFLWKSAKCNTCTESKSTKHNWENVGPISLTPIASKTWSR